MTTKRASICPYMVTIIILSVSQLCLSASVASRTARICVGSDVDCSQLRKIGGSIFTCVATRDRVDCLKKIRNREAEFGYFEAEDLKMAALIQDDKDPSTQFEANIEFSTGKEVRHVYLLVHNASNTEPKTLCHPGFNRENFYPRALYTPTTLDTRDPTGDIESLISSLNHGWTSACLPGAWSPDPITDRKLKREYPQLCDSCVRKSCDLGDHYAGAEALQCLLDKSADAAIVSDVDFKMARAKNPEIEKLYHFCSNKEDLIRPLSASAAADGEPCDWGQRPLPVLLSRSCLDEECKTKQQIWLKALSNNKVALKSVLDLPKSTKVSLKASAITPMEIIKQAGYKLEKSIPKDYVTLCTQTEIEQEKCKDLAMATSAYSANKGIGVKCFFNANDSSCYSDVYFGNADVITLDGADVYQATKDYGFDRLVSEVYDETAATPTSSYYAVAVIRAESNITSLEDLQGRKSCHTGIGKTAGWKMPVATLLEQRIIEPLHCDYVSAMAEFFSGGSCAPGGKSSKYNKQQNHVDRLCRLCVGEGEDQCARNNAEPFYSYSGAFRCLVHGGGDVAFVKHTTVPSLTDGSTSASWAVGLDASQFKLLCPTGGTAAISEFKTCNLALVPAHETVVSGRMSEARKKMVRETLLGISEVFNADAAGSKTFRLFGNYHSHPDLLFKNSAVHLRALSEDDPQERERKSNYFKKLDEMHSCEVRVCALQGQMADCETMAKAMLPEGHQFVCVSARDRMDCVNRVARGQVDMSPVPGSFLGINPDLRVLAVMKEPTYSQQEFRYKAVTVVRKATVKKISDLRGKKSCHTGYGRTTGWRIPVALLKRVGVISPSCSPHQSTLEHEIVGVATAFNRACIPGDWSLIKSLDDSLKNKYKAMCSMCSRGTCAANDAYAGYTGALLCLTQNGGDVAFSKLSKVTQFFAEHREVNIQDYGLLCQDNRIVDIDSQEAGGCYWASRPWDAYVAHGGASDAKVQRLYWALSQARLKGEEDLDVNSWYFTTLGIGDAYNIETVLENVKTREFYSKTRMDIVETEEMCTEDPVRFCVKTDEEENKCNDLKTVLSLKGISPPLQCVRGNDVDDCVFLINVDKADIISLDSVDVYKNHRVYNILNLMSESPKGAEDTPFFLLAVIKMSPDINTFNDLPGKTTCSAGSNTNDTLGIEYTLTDCVNGKIDFFGSFTDAIGCLTHTGKDVAFVNLAYNKSVGGEVIPPSLDSENFKLLCSDGVNPLSMAYAPECNLKSPTNMVITRYSDTSARRSDMTHLLAKSSEQFGKPDSFFRLFYEYFSKKDLLFKDTTTKLIQLQDEHYQVFATKMWQQACKNY